MVANLELLVIGVEAEALDELDNALVPALEIVEGKVGAHEVASGGIFSGAVLG
jgi:hypothetical protein